MVDVEDAGGGIDGRSTWTRREMLARVLSGVGGAVIAGAGLATPAAAGPTVAPGGRHATSRPAVPRMGQGATRLSGTAQPRSVCGGRAGVVVVGETPTGEAVSWRTSDGGAWSAGELPPPGPGEADVWGVAAHGDRFVAVGSLLQREAARVAADHSASVDPDVVTFTVSRRVPTVWWTADGASWHGETLDAVEAAHAQLIAVSCDSTVLVAVGSTLDADGVQGDGGLVLVSTDGVRWERGDLSAADVTLAEGSFTGVVDAGGAWFATSSDMTGGAVWTSRDARTWSLLADSRRQFSGVTLQGIAVRGRRVIVAATGLTDHRTSYHTSVDGCRSWTPSRPRVRALGHSDTTVTDVGVVAGAVVVVGTSDGAPVIEGGVG